MPRCRSSPVRFMTLLMLRCRSSLVCFQTLLMLRCRSSLVRFQTLFLLRCRSSLVCFQTLLMLRCRSSLVCFQMLLMLRCRRRKNADYPRSRCAVHQIHWYLQLILKGCSFCMVPTVLWTHCELGGKNATDKIDNPSNVFAL